jgi:hypothetical protein
VANTLTNFRGGAVGFIDWLDVFREALWAEKSLSNVPLIIEPTVAQSSSTQIAALMGRLMALAYHFVIGCGEQKRYNVAANENEHPIFAVYSVVQLLFAFADGASGESGTRRRLSGRQYRRGPKCASEPDQRRLEYCSWLSNALS